MKWTPWQIIALVTVVATAAQSPMFALASKIDDDEKAKSALGYLAAAVFTGIFAFVLKMIKGNPDD